MNDLKPPVAGARNSSHDNTSDVTVLLSDDRANRLAACSSQQAKASPIYSCPKLIPRALLRVLSRHQVRPRASTALADPVRKSGEHGGKYSSQQLDCFDKVYAKHKNLARGRLNRHSSAAKVSDQVEEGSADYLPVCGTVMDEPLLKAVSTENTFGETSDSNDDAEGLSFVHIEYYREDPVRGFFYKIGIVLTCGILALLCRWMPKWKVSLLYRKANHPVDATMVLALGHDGQWTECHVQQLREAAFEEMAPSTQASSDSVSDNHVCLSDSTVRFFDYRYIRHFYSAAQNCYVAPVFSLDVSAAELNERFGDGVASEGEADARRALFGSNVVEIPVPSNATLLANEVLHPFYVFQIWSVIVWMLEPYYYYATCIAIISLFSAISGLISTRRNIISLRDMARFTCQVTCIRGGEQVELDSSKLVPGDVVVIEDGMTMPCDCVLLRGGAVVNESMLTGESVPMLKNAFTELSCGERKLDLEKDKVYLLFSGTQVIETRASNGKVLAVVSCTGFGTAKGRLVRSILFPKPNKFKFYSDSFKFVGVLAIFATAGFLFSIDKFLYYQVNLHDMILNACDIVTVAVPPALPAAMMIGTEFAISRLKKKKIFCISPPRVNVCGKIDVMCFDKTGTLTEDGLDVLGVVPASAVSSPDDIMSSDNITAAQDAEGLVESIVGAERAVVRAMACCHSLTKVKGVLVGDPLDIVMFESTGWSLEDQTGASEHSEGATIVRSVDGDSEVGLVRQLEFNSDLQRMSVVCSSPQSNSLFVVTKGAPEVVFSLCLPGSVTKEARQQTDSLTKAGYRVLALAHKPNLQLKWAKALRSPRELLESDLEFLGLLVMENRLKKETPGTIEQLNSADIRTIMVTGDHVLTAGTVARKCAISRNASQLLLTTVREDGVVCWTSLDDPSVQVSLRDFSLPKFSQCDLAVTGAAFKIMLDAAVESSQINQPPPSLADGVSFSNSNDFTWQDWDCLLDKASIFARMSPDQKQYLIESLADRRGCTVGMCGDGANDCGALKSAHVGVSLSEAEASIAAPFTSHTPNISCVLDVIKEGRAALVTSFQCFKYMALYSVIQFTTVVQLYTINSNLGDWQYLWIDMFIILPLAIFMAYTGPYHKVCNRQPQGSLMSVPVLGSILGQSIIASGFQIAAYEYTARQAWYVPLKPDSDPDNNIQCMETTSAFHFSCFQYLFIVVSFSISKPFRKPMITNVVFTVSFLVLLGLTCMLVLTDIPWIVNLFQFSKLPIDFRITLVGLAVVNFAVSWLYERATVALELCWSEGQSLSDITTKQGILLVSLSFLACSSGFVWLLR